APIDVPAKWRELFDQVEYAGEKTLDGKVHHLVRAYPRGAPAKPELQYYEVDTGLLVRIEAQLSMDGAEVTGVITYGDFRYVDGILLPHSIRKELAGGLEVIEIKLEKVEHNRSIPSSTFEPPPEIRRLIEKSKNRPSGSK
ncbi:MAG: hypothetical protein KJ645_08140, partial [Planctomycetes bacterium]|nr:hypothetical protein [Planctomycetota bacterium]